MIRFITRILLISIFFIGLGAIAEGVLKAINPTKNQFVFEQKSECETNKIKVIRFSKVDAQPQFQMMLPSLQELPKIDEPIAQKKVIVLSQSEFVD